MASITPLTAILSRPVRCGRTRWPRGAAARSAAVVPSRPAPGMGTISTSVEAKPPSAAAAAWVGCVRSTRTMAALYGQWTGARLGDSHGFGGGGRLAGQHGDCDECIHGGHRGADARLADGLQALWRSIDFQWRLIRGQHRW